MSIPLATFDRVEILLDRTLPALLNQTYERVEVLVVGDGSSEKDASRLARFRHPKVTFLNLRRRSRYPSHAVHRWMVAGSRPRNVGAKLARGDLLLWMSDDDLLYSSAVEAFLEVFRADDAEVVLGGVDIDSSLDPWAAGRPRRPGPPAAKIWVAREYLRWFRWSRTSWMKYWNRPCDLDLFARMQHAGVRFTATTGPVGLVLPVEGTNLHGSEAWAALDADTDAVVRDDGGRPSTKSP